MSPNIRRKPDNSIKKVRISLDPPVEDALDLSIFEKSAEMYENPYHQITLNHQITPSAKCDTSLTFEQIAKLDSEIDFSRPSTHKKNVEYLKQFEQEMTTMKKVIKKRF